MEILILADYYEHNHLLKKAQRLRAKNSKIIYGGYRQYNDYLGRKYTYGYDQGNGLWFNYGFGDGYYKGNGVYYRWSY